MKRPLRPCVVQGCPELVRSPERYCPGHKRKRNRRYDSQRGTAAQRGYGARWRRLRKLVLSEEPLCRECLVQGKITPATEVDHIVSRSQGGTDDRENLQALCKPCHSRKTAKEDGRWG